jgi:hypothetical protein
MDILEYNHKSVEEEHLFVNDLCYDKRSNLEVPVPLENMPDFTYGNSE